MNKKLVVQINEIVMKNLSFIVFLFLVACGQKKQDNQQAEDAVSKEFLQEVVTAKAVSQKLQKAFMLTGKITSDPDKTVSYAPLISGVIVKSYFTLGDRVSKGQIMLDIRSSELSSLQSELTIAHRNLQSAESKYADKLISETELIEARSTYEKLQADLSLYGENKENGIFSIKAPIGGYVIEKNGNAGSTVAAGGETLFSIADLNTVWVIANIYAGNLQSIHEGQLVEITTVAYPNEVFKGKIDFISQVFDPEDNALRARIVLPNPGLKLKPEMSVEVRLLNESNTEMVTIPSEAIIFDNNSYFVVVGNKDFAIRQVVPFDHFNGITYISEGLKPGEEVSIKNQLLIYDQLKGK